jgi:hypothetical protein
MTPEEEQAAARLFAEGRSEREVASELDISPSSAHRLRKKLAQAEPVAQAPEPEQHDAAVLQAADEVLTDEALLLLEAERGRLAGELENFQARAQASMSALQSLEAERDHLLLSTGDSSAVDGRLDDAARDLRKWTRGVELIAPQIAEADARIAELGRIQDLAAKRAELAAAASEHARLRSGVGEVQRDCVAAVKAAAERLVAVVADEAAASARVAELAFTVNRLERDLGEPPTIVPEPPSTALAVSSAEAVPGQPAGGLLQALNGARLGNVKVAAAGLGVACGWLPPAPPTPEAIARGREWRAAMDKQAAEAKARADYGIGPDGSGKVNDLDHNGRPIRHRQPHPLDVYGPGYANTLGYSYAPGARFE